MTISLAPLPTRKEIELRLKQIFPEGSELRSYCTRDMAVKTVFTMLYIGAIEGSDCFLA